MNHETMRERIALRTYGELDAEEAAVLEEHLAACEDCRRYAASFAEGLGRIAASARTASDDLPSGWSDRLRDATRESRAGSRARARIPSWWTAVAGFAAGVVATAAIVRGPASRIAPGPLADGLGALPRRDSAAARDEREPSPRAPRLPAKVAQRRFFRRSGAGSGGGAAPGSGAIGSAE
jgi:anti-sigma factor RsiW